MEQSANIICKMRMRLECWKLGLSNRFADRSVEFYETETDRSRTGRKGDDKYENRAPTRGAAHRSQRSEPNWGCQGRRKKRETGEIERAGNSHAFCARIGNCWSLKSRASDDWAWIRGDAKRGRKNVRCTCLYLFCIISAILLQGTAQETGRFYNRTYSLPLSLLVSLFPFLFLVECYSLLFGGVPLFSSRELIRPHRRSPRAISFLLSYRKIVKLRKVLGNYLNITSMH